MKEYYEKQVKQAEMARKFIIDGIKSELFALENNSDTDIMKEDLDFYAEMIAKADADLQIAKGRLDEYQMWKEEKNA